jgi:hypothetical protein
MCRISTGPCVADFRGTIHKAIADLQTGRPSPAPGKSPPDLQTVVAGIAIAPLGYYRVAPGPETVAKAF